MKAKVEKSQAKAPEKTTPMIPRVDQFINDLDRLIKFEEKLVAEMYLKKIKAASSDKSGLNAELLHSTFIKIAASAELEKDKAWILSTESKDSLTLEQKARRLARFLAKKVEIPSHVSVEHFREFLGIIYTDSELLSFIENPQKYINSHPNLTAHQLQVLQFVANDPVFNRLPSINRVVPSNTFIYTPLTAHMAQLGLDNYGSMDALRFDHCINPDFKEDIIEKSKKTYHGPQVIGMGVQSSYDRQSIAKTASQVKKMQIGACHTFAQLAADQLLTSIEKRQLNPMHIKLVSHKGGLGSHTFLLINHNSDDLTDLSGCLFVDPWAVAMGYRNTYGIFTTANYPYPGMTTNLECSYDNQAPIVSTKQGNSLAQELNRSLSRGGFFSASNSRNQTEVKLTPQQRIAIQYLTELMKYAENTLQNGTKRDLMNTLIDAVMNESCTAKTAIKQATLAIHARSIEKTETGFTWKGKMPIDDSILPILNTESIMKFWKAYIPEFIGGSKEEVKNIDHAMLEKIVDTLNKTEEREFTPNSPQEHKLN
ncbi:hypothetical protein [Legionella sp.]|uniref:hypothetical protein n=1 Tax=Legionella sp. TaxID=459 RepID=UPI000CC991CE|nr:hypothetical protein [Legionella sp.]PJE09353.1 MAG: hypothetical protein CK430_11210 [Legionella sp.]